jgi:hypothetical protein
MTCAHCINNPNSDDPMAKHKDGDVYVLVARNGNGAFHRAQIPNLEEKKGLYIYPDLDVAILELPDSFYINEKRLFKHPDDYLILSKDLIDIGSDVGVIGYPFQKLNANPDQAGIDTSSIFVRVDKGVINTCYLSGNTKMYTYEFTMSFNPGNSGGPIITPENGKVVAWVQGFNSNVIPINDGNEKIKIFAHYSYANSTVNLIEISQKHNLAI